MSSMADRVLCRHYEPKHRRGCVAGHWVPRDCPSCTMYDADHKALNSTRPMDIERVTSWPGEFEHETL